MKKVRIDAFRFLRMVESGLLEFGGLSFALNFLKACRESGATEFRIAQPEHGRWLYIVIPSFPIWCDYEGSAL